MNVGGGGGGRDNQKKIKQNKTQSQQASIN